MSSEADIEAMGNAMMNLIVHPDPGDEDLTAHDIAVRLVGDGWALTQLSNEQGCIEWLAQVDQEAGHFADRLAAFFETLELSDTERMTGFMRVANLLLDRAGQT